MNFRLALINIIIDISSKAITSFKATKQNIFKHKKEIKDCTFKGKLFHSAGALNLNAFYPESFFIYSQCEWDSYVLWISVIN